MLKLKYVFNNYKTKETYGRQLFSVTLFLHELIQKFIQVAELEPGDRLLGYESSNQLTIEMKKIEDKGYHPNVFRHSFATWINEQNLSLKKRKECSDMMSHSVIQQLEYNRGIEFYLSFFLMR